MKKILERLLVFFLGVPLIVALVALRQFHFLALNIVLCLTSVLSSLELTRIYRVRYRTLTPAVLAFMTGLLVASAYLFVFFGKHIDYTSIVFFVLAMAIMSSQVIFSHGDFSNSLGAIASSVFIIFYSGFFSTFITRMTLLESAAIKIPLFFLIVFFSDSAAWLFGVLFGKHNRGLVAASPNKSVAGFIGGFTAAVVLCVLFQSFFPDVFGGELFKAMALGALCNIASVLGDLVESVLKRSADIKDSGVIIPGRGGMLDCVDSVFFTAPVFYVLCHLFF